MKIGIIQDDSYVMMQIISTHIQTQVTYVDKQQH